MLKKALLRYYEENLKPRLDVNEDGKVDAKDFIDTALTLLLGDDEQFTSRFDVNEDGSVDVDDAIAVLVDISEEIVNAVKEKLLSPIKFGFGRSPKASLKTEPETEKEA